MNIIIAGMVCDVEIATSPRRRVDDTKPTPASNIDMGDMGEMGNGTGGRGESEGGGQEKLA